MDRRAFLEINLRLAALGLVPGAVLSACTKAKPLARLGALMSASHVVTSDGKHTVFYYYDLDEERLDEIHMPLEFPHVAIAHPRHRNLVVVPESGGVNACVIDLRAKRAVKKLVAGEGRQFGGHCIFTADGKSLFFSEFEPIPSGRGFVSEWNGDDFSVKRTISSGGRFPHDLMLGENKGVLHVANLGEEEGRHVRRSGIFVSRVDLATGKITERIELHNNPEEMNPDPLKGGESLARNDITMRLDASYFISFMKVVHPEFQNFTYAHAHQKTVDVWSIGKKQLIREHRFEEQPRALTLLATRSHLAVALESGALRFINLRSHELDLAIQPKWKIPVTTHLNSWSGISDDGPAIPPSATPVGSYS